MTIEVRDGRFFSRWYFASAAGVPYDVMAAVWKDSDADHWEAAYRFRYYNDSKVFDSTDEKRWYSVQFPKEMNEPQVLRSFGSVLCAATQAAGLEMSIVTVQSDSARKIIGILSQEPWFKSRVEKVN